MNEFYHAIYQGMTSCLYILYFLLSKDPQNTDKSHHILLQLRNVHRQNL